jgi:hypothetical protein
MKTNLTPVKAQSAGSDVQRRARNSSTIIRAARIKLGGSRFLVLWDEILSDKFVMRGGGQQLDKAAVIKMVAANKCEVKNWKLDDPQIGEIDADTFVLSYKGTFEGSCTSLNGNAMKISSPIRAATVWVRTGGTWQAAFHGQNLIFDPKNLRSPAKAEGKKEEPKKDDKAATNSNTTTTKPAADPNTAAMMAAETSIWEDWMAKDAKKLEDITTTDLSFQNIFGIYFANKADTIKDWIGTRCSINRVAVTNGVGTMLSPTVGMLSSTGTAEGTCDGQKLASVPIYGTSIFVRNGDSWKLAFSLNRLD